MDIFEYLYQQRFKKGIVPTLERLIPIYESYQLKLKPEQMIHVAGTNGKGSTIAFIRSILEHAGYSVGVFTSPHLYDITERFYCGGNNIKKEHLVTILTELKDRIDHYQQNFPYHFITFFEYMTLAALIWFDQQQPDFILLEVGMGGRFDATNIVDAGIGVITTIGLDHVSYLGDTPEKIAFEKGGIIKNDQKVILGTIDEGPLEVIRQQIIEKGAVEYHHQNSLKPFISGLKGVFQQQNLKTALAVIDCLKLDISNEILKEGILKTEWPGRYELLQENPVVIRDVAHNVMGMEALKQSLDYEYPGIPKIVVFGVMQDKDIGGMMEIIDQFATEIYFTPLPFPRSATVELIQQHTTLNINKILPEKSLEKAIQRAVELKGMVVVTGSIYLMEYL